MKTNRSIHRLIHRTCVMFDDGAAGVVFYSAAPPELCYAALEAVWREFEKSDVPFEWTMGELLADIAQDHDFALSAIGWPGSSPYADDSDAGVAWIGPVISVAVHPSPAGPRCSIVHEEKES